MTAAATQLAIFAIQEAIALAPQLVGDLQTLFASGTPTAADFDALRAKVAAESYFGFVPDSALANPGGTGPGATIDALAETTANNVQASTATAVPVL